MPNTETQKSVEPPASASAKAKPQKVVPISVFVSWKLSKLFVRRGFTPLFDVPAKSKIQRSRLGHTFLTQWDFRTRA